MAGPRADPPVASDAEGEGGVFQNVEPPPRRVSPGSPFALLGFLGLCLLVGLSDSAITRTGKGDWYRSLRHPPGTPPDWAFPVAWSALYLLMALAAWMVWRHAGVARRGHYGALRLWGWQLLLNALWTPAFFGLRSPGLALVVVVALLGILALTVRAFLRVDRAAGLMLVPYLAWVAYATWLTAGVWWLNGA